MAKYAYKFALKLDKILEEIAFHTLIHKLTFMKACFV